MSKTAAGMVPRHRRRMLDRFRPERVLVIENLHEGEEPSSHELAERKRRRVVLFLVFPLPSFRDSLLTIRLSSLIRPLSCNLRITVRTRDTGMHVSWASSASSRRPTASKTLRMTRSNGLRSSSVGAAGGWDGDAVGVNRPGQVARGADHPEEGIVVAVVKCSCLHG